MHMTADLPVYDVALSFAAEDRPTARAIADELIRRGVSVFFDQFDMDLLWGRDLHRHLSNIYDRSRFVVLLVSKAYTQKSWTQFERKTALARAGDDPGSQVLPVALDDSIRDSVSGFPPNLGYVDLRQTSVERVADLVVEKLRSGAQMQVPAIGPTRVHVIPSEGRWVVKESGASTVEVHSSREAAIKAARRIAAMQTAELVVHGRNGMVETRESPGERM
jgi:hypothetical protein